MNPEHSIIVYRSQSEANSDYFINEMLVPWIYNHWIIVLVGLIVTCLFTAIVNKKR